MSNISTVYDRLIVVIAALFTSKMRISNPYDLANNADIVLKDAWGLKMAAAGTSEISLYPFHSEAREFSVVLCRKVHKLREDADALDAPIKALMEDVKALTCAMVNGSQLSIPNSVGKIDFISSSGVEFTRTGKQDNISTEVKFRIDIMEAI